MTDYYEDPPEVPKPPSHGRLVAAGVVGALVLGAGLGLWARPAPQQQLVLAKSMAPEDAPRPALQIIVDDDPAPIGPLLEVLPGDTLAANEAQPPLRPPAPILEPIAPRRPTAGLMKVDAVVAVEPAPVPVPAAKVEEPTKPKAAPKPAPKQKVVKTPEKPKVQKAKAEPKPKPEKLRVVAAKPKKDDNARAPKAAKLAQVEQAKAQKLAKAEKVAKAEKLAKAEKAKAAKFAQFEAKKQKAAKAQAETRRLATVTKATKAAPRKVKPEVVKKKTQLAQAKPTKKLQVQKPKVEKAFIKPAVAPKPKPPAPKKLVIPRGEGPMRVARSDACASADPGETAVCSDRRLGARDRQLQQAYRNAEAAGVPATALRRQQARWLQSRAAAAREAPWAVEDVYEARISELNDLTRDAREN